MAKLLGPKHQVFPAGIRIRILGLVLLGLLGVGALTWLGLLTANLHAAIAERDAAKKATADLQVRQETELEKLKQTHKGEMAELKSEANRLQDQLSQQAAAIRNVGRKDAETEALRGSLSSANARIEELQMQVAGAQGQVASIRQATAAQESAKTSARALAWNRIQQGLSKEQVLQLLGQPLKIDPFVNLETWHYEGAATVELKDDHVTGWSKPSS